LGHLAHVSWLPSEDIFIVPEKVGEREFLFFWEVGTKECHLGRIIGTQVDLDDIRVRGGVMILAFLVAISMSSGLVCCARLAISYASKACCALATIWMAFMSQS
jgi:hypothetical protein